MELIKDGKVIQSTRKAYEVIYKGQGYVIHTPNVDDGEDELIEEVEDDGDGLIEEVEDDGDELIEEVEELNYDDVTRADIMKMLDGKGIDYDPKDVKQVLFDLLGSE